MTPANSLQSFQPKNQPISRQIADKIQQMVMDGELRPGDRLPSERQLSLDLNVSRNMIREALALLEERGIVAVQVGSGTYVLEANVESVTRTFSLYAQRTQVTIAQMFEVRWALEVENARLAATNISPKQISQLEMTITQMQESMNDLPTFTNADIRFHRLLAYASQNPLFPVFLDTIQEMLQKQAIIATALPNAPQNAIRHHQNIFAAIQAKDATAARSAMSAHLESAWEYILKAVKNPEETIGVMRFVDTDIEED